jgi:hypothetical protein
VPDASSLVWDDGLALLFPVLACIRDLPCTAVLTPAFTLTLITSLRKLADAMAKGSADLFARESSSQPKKKQKLDNKSTHPPGGHSLQLQHALWNEISTVLGCYADDLRLPHKLLSAVQLSVSYAKRELNQAAAAKAGGGTTAQAEVPERKEVMLARQAVERQERDRMRQQSQVSADQLITAWSHLEKAERDRRRDKGKEAGGGEKGGKKRKQDDPREGCVGDVDDDEETSSSAPLSLLQQHQHHVRTVR